MSTFVFGYGSLIFKPPPFKDITYQIGYISHYVRRFSQNSHDHRGTELNPGRVVTLINELEWNQFESDEPKTKSHQVWGKMYRIPEESETIWSYLDHREKDGYSLKEITVYGLNSLGEEYIIEPNCKVYVGEIHNPSFAGQNTMEEVSNVIVNAVGPSGKNREYLYKLCEAMKELYKESNNINHQDEYLIELERLVKLKDPDLLLPI